MKLHERIEDTQNIGRDCPIDRERRRANLSSRTRWSRHFISSFACNELTFNYIIITTPWCIRCTVHWRVAFSLKSQPQHNTNIEHKVKQSRAKFPPKAPQHTPVHHKFPLAAKSLVTTSFVIEMWQRPADEKWETKSAGTKMITRIM